MSFSLRMVFTILVVTFFIITKEKDATHQTEDGTKERREGFLLGDLTHEQGPLTSWTRTGAGSTT